jgi:hypothetical protein
MKKLITAVVAFALALTVVAPVAASAQTTASYTYNTNLTIGSRGADVVALQSFLEAKGVLTIPAGTAKGYFGALTRSALAAYQSMKGITPAAGYFGPITRAAVSADSSVSTTTTPGCAVGSLFNSITGQPCTTSTSTTPGCVAGAMYSSTTGQACSTTTTSPVSTTGEGTLDVRLSSNPADNSSIRTQTDVPVYGLEFRARLADVAVQTLDLQVTSSINSNFSTQENPGTLINTIKVWDGSTVLATVPANISTFTKDSNQNYYVRLTGLNFVVPKDTTKVLTVSFSTNSIDVTRYVRIEGYNSSSIRAVSGNGVNTFYSADNLLRTHSFEKPGTSTLTLSASGNTLRSMNNRVNGSDPLRDVVLGTFNLKSDTGASKLLAVNTTVTASGTFPTTLYLYNGSTLIQSKTASSTTVFDNLDTSNGSTIAQSETPTTFTIKADFLGSTVNGSAASTTVTSVTFETPNGNTGTASGNAVTNVPQYVYTKAAVIKLAGTPTISVTNPSVTTGTTTMTASFPLTIQALGGNVVVPGTTGAEFDIVFSNGTNYTATAKSVVTIPNNDISDGSTANVTVTASINPSGALTNGLYNAAITAIRWNAGNGTATQTYGLEDFKTSQAVQFNR